MSIKALAGYAKYDSYKDSGVDWLGDMPEGWAVRKFRFTFVFTRGLNITKQDLDEEGIPCINYGEIHSKFGFEFKPLEHKLKCVNISFLKNNQNALLKYGDFVFADTSEDIQGSGNFTHLNAHEIVFAGYHTLIAKPIVSFNSKFMAYVFESESFRNQVRARVKGVKVYSITQSVLKETSIWLPSKTEQLIISRFLDRKTGQIDQAIVVKQKKIEELNEYKKIVIQNTVTKGLSFNAKMKDSGLEWVGNIPENWSIKKSRFVFEFSKGLTITKANLQDSGVLCVNYGEIHSKYGFELRPDEHELKYVDTSYMDSNPKALLSNGDFVFSDTSEDIEGSGNFTYINGTANIFAGYHTVIAKPIIEFKSRFVAYIFDSISYRSQIRHRVKGVKVYSITQSILKNTFIWLPPKQEQEDIVKYLDEVLLKAKQASDAYKTEIERLREYKTILINQAVTGKIKVS